MSVLIAYYFRVGENYFGGAYRNISVGNTEKAAKMISEITGGKLFRSEQKNPRIPTYIRHVSLKPAEGN